MESNRRLYVVMAVVALVGIVGAMCLGAFAGAATGYWAGRWAATGAVSTLRNTLSDIPSGSGLPVPAEPGATPLAPMPGLTPMVMGAQVTQVIAGSPAERAGIREGDIITALNGTDVTAATTLARVVRRYRPGDVVTAVLWRDGNTQSIRVTLGNNPDDANVAYLGVYYVFATGGVHTED
jgi:membrane-associated protease RseP (regulator of RpoE activity)